MANNSPWHHLYNTAAWRKLRAAQLAGEPLCQLCSDRGYTTLATIADHVEPHGGDVDKFFGGALQSLCATCHSAIKQALEKSGRLRGAGLDGRPLDPAHPWNREPAT
jgi:hypothetical protein